jgi:hypothetical protein
MGVFMPRQKKAVSLLIGTWRSDKRRTIQQWVYPKRLAAARRKRFESIFGKLVVRFTAKKHFKTYGRKTSSQPYRVLWSREGPIFPQIVVVYGKDDQESAQHMFFDTPNSFYIQGGKCAEFFKRVKP